MQFGKGGTLARRWLINSILNFASESECLYIIMTAVTWIVFDKVRILISF